MKLLTVYAINEDVCNAGYGTSWETALHQAASTWRDARGCTDGLT